MPLAHIRLYTDEGEEIYRGYGFVPAMYVTGPSGQPAINTYRIGAGNEEVYRILLRLECTPVDPNR